MPMGAAMGDLPSTTSASQLSLYARCGRAYWFRYVARTPPERRSLALLLGSAVHGGVGWHFEQRLGGRQPGIDEAAQVARADLLADACIDGVSSTDLDTLEADATRLVRHYLEQAETCPFARLRVHSKSCSSTRARGKRCHAGCAATSIS